MDITRKFFDGVYDKLKEPIFNLTNSDPEVAHNLFGKFCRMLYSTGLDNLLKTKNNDSEIIISNAAGFNKNCEIPPRVLQNYEFDRVVIGSANGEYWKGNERPRIIRFPERESLINWMGLNSEGAESIAYKLNKYYEKGFEIPITISVTPTPNPEWDREKRLEDVAKTINSFCKIGCVDRFEYNPSCPNTEIKKEDQLDETKNMLKLHRELAANKNLYVKCSPDWNEKEIDKFIESTFDLVEGYVLTNTTTQHGYGKGGGSGELVWPHSVRTQKLFHERLKNTDKKRIACGGINSKDRIRICQDYGASEFQIFTPLIFRGTRLLRELKN